MLQNLKSVLQIERFPWFSVFHNKALKSETKHVLKLTFILLKSSLHIPIEIEHHQLSFPANFLSNYNHCKSVQPQAKQPRNWCKLHVASTDTNWTSPVTNRSISYVNRNNRVKCQHLPGTGTRTRGDWPSGFELSILAQKIEHRPRINARMNLFSGWLLLNDHFSLLYFANQHKSQTFYTIFHCFVAFFTLPWATPNSVNFSVFPYHGEIVGLI